jgi:thiol:disulfide interchange protein DsbD
MKKLVITFAAFILISTLHAQVQDPVKWNYSAVKKADKEYAVTISATLEPNWHIYSMTTPNGGPVATTFSFNRNPLVTIAGKTQETGKPQTIYDDIFGVDVKYYSEAGNIHSNCKT